MPRFSINETTYFELRSLKAIAQLPSFIEQRDIDAHRLPPISQHLKAQLDTTGTLTLDTPIVLLECASYDSFLLDRQQNRVHTVVIDGQHRVCVLKHLLAQHPQCAKLQLPVYVHIVDTIQAGRKIQYSIFEQKPVDQYDKLQRTDYHLTEMLHAFATHYKQHHPAIAKRHFKDGRYQDKHIRPRRLHFLMDELAHHIKNSCNVHLWMQREIQHTELVQAVDTIIKDKCHTLDGLPLVEQRKAVGIPKAENYALFQRYLQKTPFQIVPYVYYKKYELLVHDVEEALGIVNALDDLEEFEEFKECV